jgi:hypothetical protein
MDNRQAVFLDKEIAHLLHKKAIRLLGLGEKAMISPLSMVTKKNSKFQPIINMHFINKFFNMPKFKFKGLNELAMMVKEGDWSATINFQDGFQHVKVHPDHQHLLRFKWIGVHYTFTVLPFSLSASPWAFTHFIQTTVAHLQQLGIHVLAYMDNLFIMGSSHAKAEQSTRTTISTLNELGWQINEEKSMLIPSQCTKFLSLLINTTATPHFKVPMEKIQAVQRDMDHLLLLHNKTSHIPVHKLVVVAGLCVSLSKAVLPGPLMLRNIFHVITS